MIRCERGDGSMMVWKGRWATCEHEEGGHGGMDGWADSRMGECGDGRHSETEEWAGDM